MMQIAIASILAGIFIGLGIVLILPKCPIDLQRSRIFFGILILLGGTFLVSVAADAAVMLFKI